MNILAQAEPVFLMSWFKPILIAAVLIGWGRLILELEKDAAFFYLKRHWINVGHMAVGLVGFGLMLLVPLFAVGFPAGLAVLIGGAAGYAVYRNRQVDEADQWTFSLQSIKDRFERMQQAHAQRSASLTLLDAKEHPIDVPRGDDPDAAAHETFEEVLGPALERGAEQLTVQIKGDQAAVAAEIDGVAYPQPAPDPTMGLSMIDYLKKQVGLDLSERRKRQTGELRVEGAAGLGRHRLELETAGSTRGMMLRLRIDRRQRLRVKFGELGLTESQAEQLREVVGELEGVVLIAAPSGQGSSTTMYSLVNEHDPYTTSVVTLEEQVPIELEGVSHNELPAGASPQEANEKLASLLRQDPNVMMLPQLKDAQMARQIAESGREMRVYSNLPANDTFDALRKWVKLVGDRRSAGKPLRAIVSQRLMRRLCPTCRTSYRPDPAVLKKLNLPADRVSQLYQASGQVVIKDKPQPCPACHGLAYRGRVGVFEVMVLDDPARNLLQQGDVERLKTHLRKQRMTWLQEAALSKVVDGVTDIKEVTRVLGGGKPGSGRVQEAKEPVA